MADDQPLVAGKYRILRPLASGGMGALFLAEHVELETVVVVKRLLELRDSEADVARFRREAKAAAALTSRHIVRVHDFGTDEAGPYLVMELLRGQDLASLLEQKGALPVAQAVEIFRQVCKAMRVAHTAGLVHRDVKPSNLFLAEEEGEIVVKVLDFGIAKRFAVREGSVAITASGMLLGSPGYMAPEQVRGQRVDTRADIWALGVVLYEMLTNAPPFYSEHVGDSLVRVCSGDYSPATSLNPSLGRGWDAFFNHALEVDIDRRIQNVDVLLHALDLVLNGASDLDRMLAGAPTLKATSGTPASLMPAPERESSLGSRRAAAELPPERHNPRTLDASQVPISEPTSSGLSSRRLLWIAASVLLVAAATWTWVSRNGESVAKEEATPAPKTVAFGTAPGSSDGRPEALPSAELPANTPKASQPSSPPTPKTQPSAADLASRKPTSKPAAPTTASPTHTKPTTPVDGAPTSTAKPKSSQPKRDPFTGLVME